MPRAATSTELTLPFIGEERARYHYPFGSLQRAGARTGLRKRLDGLDAEPARDRSRSPSRASSTRTATPSRCCPEEALDLETAVAAFTRGSAYVNFLEDETGSIEPGKLADLVVLDRDLFDPGAGPVGDARVLLTLVEGEAVHDVALGGRDERRAHLAGEIHRRHKGREEEHD